MADNLGVSVGADATMGTKDVGGIHHQRVIQIGETSTVTKVDAAESATTLIAAVTTGRYGLIIKNDSPNRLYLKYGSAADWQNSFTDWVEPGSTWTMPAPIYSGIVTGSWRPMAPGLQINAGSLMVISGQAYVTHLTP